MWRLFGFLRKADPGVKTTESWWSLAKEAWGVLSGATLLTAALSWLAQRWTEVTGGSWPAAIFMGIGAACVIVLVVSAGLVAWRLFNPLSGSDNAASGRAMIADNVVSHADFSREIATINTKLGDAAKSNSDLWARISNHDRQVDMIAVILGYELSLETLRRSAKIPVGVAVSGLSEITTENCERIREISQLYERKILAIVDQRWQRELRYALEFGETRGIDIVEGAAPDDRPEGVDAFLLRRTVIANARAGALNQKLHDLIADHESGTISNINRLTELHDQYAKGH